MKKLLLAFLALASGAAYSQSTDVRAVTTYESAGLYWVNSGANAATGCEVKFRRVGDSSWTQGLPLWFDVRDGECRGSLVNLAPGTDYEAQFNLPALPVARTLTFRTWSNQVPVLRTVTVNSGSGTLNITEGGSATGYVVYQGAPGAVLDAVNASAFNVSVNASYVVVRGLTLRGAQQDAIRISANVTDVIIEDNDISGWGRTRGAGLGTDMDSAVRAVCSTPTMQRATVQRNTIHEPRYGSNSWSDGHPAGPQAITFGFCGGNHVIRHNDIWSTPGRYYNDIIGGEDNYSTTGFPNKDSDIYGNKLSHAWDDAIEAEGGNKNVRIWGNYMDRTGTGIATTPTALGPIYMFRNVYNRSRMLGGVPPDQDDRQVMFKSGSDAALGDGRRYIFHNTILQATEAGSIYGLGASGGVTGTSTTRLLNNTVSRNNIWHLWKSWTAYDDVGVGNTFSNDMYNGGPGAPIVGGIHATPTYAPGHGWTSEANGQYQLAAGTPGHDQGVRIPNFNDVFSGTAPDVGAAEAGTAAMRFGVAASAGPAVTPPGSPRRDVSFVDFNADGKADIVWRNTSDGSLLQWLMNGATVLQQTSLGGAGTTDQPKRIADFNGDSKADIVWQDTDGTVSMTLFNGASILSDSVIVGAGTGWSVTQVGDLDGDGKADLIWTHTSGAVQAWLMNGATATQVAGFVAAGSGWSVSRLADLNGDGKTDILWQHTSGSVTAWLMNGLAITQVGSFAAAGSGWAVALAADLDGDGKQDLLWAHSNGAVQAWLMNGLTVTQVASFVAPGAGYTATHTGDLNGDGKSDILWRYSDGTVLAWIMGPALTIANIASFTGSGNAFAITHVRDLNGDGKADLLWGHPDGTTLAWIMNGLTATSVSQFTGAGPYRIVPPAE